MDDDILKDDDGEDDDGGVKSKSMLLAKFAHAKQGIGIIKQDR